MKNIKIFEEFINEGDKYDDFVDYISKLSEREKEFISNLWMDSDEIESTLGSALWTTLRLGGSFKDRSLRFLASRSSNPEKDLEDFVEKYSG